MSKEMHVLIIPSWYPTKDNRISGIFFKEQAEALAEKIDFVNVLNVSGYSLRNLSTIINEGLLLFKYKINIETTYKIRTFQFNYIVFPKIRTIQRIQNKIFYNIAIKKYINLFGKPDICHLHSYSKGDLALFIKRKYNVPYIVTEHFSGFARKLIDKREIIFAKNVFENAEKRIAVSNKFADLLCSITGQKFIYVPNMTDPTYFTIKKIISESNEFAFLNIGSLDENKNQNMLIKAFYKKFKDKRNVKLIIAGNGPLEANLKAKVKQLNLENKVIFFGSASREQVKELYHHSNAFVLSSKYETFGVVLIEALSCGLPVIATKCGGPESIIIDEKIGELVEIDTDQLAGAMERIYSNIEKYDSDYIRKYAIDNFSKEVVTSKIIEIYKDVILSKSENYKGTEK